MDIKAFLQQMFEKGASDMHIRAHSPVVLRINGELIPIQDKKYTPDETSNFAQLLMNDDQRRVFEAKKEIDLAYNYTGIGRFRINVFTQKGMVSLVLRLVPAKIPTIPELKLPPVIAKIAENQRGLVLMAGTTGCGKSTTLAAMIDHINTTRTAHIVTIEDPMEFIHADKKSIVSQRELGFDTTSYPDALRNVVRQDPNVILLGEMRDLETMSTAITAAQTGHLVFSTIHTVNASQTINRIIDLFPMHQQNQIRLMLSDTLKAVISQRLLPHVLGNGRVPAVEVLVVTPLVKKMIEDNKLDEIPNLMKQGQYYGMQTFNQVLVKLYKDGEVKLEDALYAASNPEELMLAIKGIETGNENASNYFEKM